jgi:hypothetical protein
LTPGKGTDELHSWGKRPRVLEAHGRIYKSHLRVVSKQRLKRHWCLAVLRGTKFVDLAHRRQEYRGDIPATTKQMRCCGLGVMVSECSTYLTVLYAFFKSSNTDMDKTGLSDTGEGNQIGSTPIWITVVGTLIT